MNRHAFSISLKRMFSQKDNGICETKFLNKDLELQSRPFYYIGFSVVVLSRLLDQLASNFDMPFLSSPVLMIIALAFLMVRVFSVALTCDIRRVLFAIVVVGLSVVSWARSGQSYLLVAALMLLGLGHIDIRKLVATSSLALLFLILLLGIIQVFQILFDGHASGMVIREGGRVRLSFFFRHPNVLAAYILMSFIGLSLGKNKFDGASAVLGIMLAVICFLVTDSRTSTAIMILYILLRVLFERYRSVNWLVKISYLFIPVVFVALVLAVTTSNVPSYLFELLQSVLSGRPGYWQLQYEALGGFTLFGQQALSGTVLYNNWVYQNVTIDCFYASALLSLGTWALPVFYFLYARVGLYSLRTNDQSVPIAILCCAFYGFTEIHMLDLAITVPMLYMGSGLLVPASKRQS